LEKSNIVIAGFMASGKTTVGKLLEELTGKKLIDTDSMIEEKTGMGITEIFEKNGEEYFRCLERSTVADAASQQNRIVAVGGGAVLDERNVETLKTKGVIYLLEVAPGEVSRRAGTGEERPLLGKDEAEIEGLMRSRERAYLAAADVVLETTGLNPGQVANKIAMDFEERAVEEGEGSH
jgi:shikimate kinase